MTNNYVAHQSQETWAQHEEKRILDIQNMISALQDTDSDSIFAYKFSFQTFFFYLMEIHSSFLFTPKQLALKTVSLGIRPQFLFVIIL